MARFVHTLLLLCAATLLHAQSLRIAQAEWFTGNDPGEGLGIAMQVADGAWDEAVEEVIASLPSGTPGNVVVSVRVKGANGYWSSAYRQVVHTGSSVPGRQARVQAGEYFWDSDPGVGNATPLLALDGDFNSALEQAIASDNTITPGAHRLFVRIQGADNGWSALFTQVVQVNTAITARDIRVQQGEFFFDSDPGEGNGVALLAFDGDWNNAIETGLASVAAPAEGSHLLYVRMRSADGTWSNEYKTVLHVSPSIPLRSVHVQAAEYYFDTDPGEGNGTPLLALDGDFDGALEQIMASEGLNGQGSHVLGVRVRGSDNGWSATFRSVVHVGPELIARDVRVQQGEFFFDSDPGEGNGAPLLAFDGNWTDAVETGASSEAAPAIGAHLLYVRMRASDGTWSNEYKTVVHVSAPLSTRPVAVVNGEYFWDIDPGEGNGSALAATDDGFDEALEDAVTSDMSELSAGPHLLGVRMQGSDGGWSAAFQQVVSVTAPSEQDLPIAISAYLQGPMISATAMSDALRTNGSFPLAEPYTALGFDHIGSGGESIDPLVFSLLHGQVVDWVFVELRDPTDPTIVLQTRVGLIKKNGDIAAISGSTRIGFNAVPGQYHVALKHRNHLGVMTLEPLPMSPSGSRLDLRVHSTPTYGSDARASAFGRALLWCGDVNHDGQLKYTGIDNDRDPILMSIGGTVPTNEITGQYAQSDVNMDGSVKYAGAGNDRDPILMNIGGTVPTNVRMGQLP
jgi:hypothetical protein